MSVNKIATVEEFEGLIKSHDGPVLVDFFATWCNPCKVIGAELPKYATQYPQTKFVKVDVDEIEDLAEKYDISSLPTLAVFKNGEISNTFVGAKISQFEEFLSKNL